MIDLRHLSTPVALLVAFHLLRGHLNYRRLMGRYRVVVDET